MERVNRFGQRFAAGVGIAAMSAVGLTVVVPGAFGAEGNVDPSARGSIVIHKHESGSQSAVGTPDGKTNVGGVGVAGVVFTAYPITSIDLSTKAGWDTLSALSVPADACGADWKSPSLAGHTFGDGLPGEATDANGNSSITNLPVRAYLVCETQAPSKVQKKAAPFVVSVPFPNNARNAAASNDGNWLYDVHVYPKNTVVEAPSKGVNVTNNGIENDAQVEFPVTTKIPSIGANERFEYFIVSDPLNALYTNGAVKSVKLDGVDVTASLYTVTAASAGNNNTASVGFKADGLEFLKQNANKTLEVTFTARVNADAVKENGGRVPNVAQVYVNVVPTPDVPPTDPPVPPVTPPTVPPTNPPAVPTNEVVTTWGNARVSKIDADNNKKLEGAKFQVYNTVSAGNFKDTCDVADIDTAGGPISVNGVNEFTSDANGVVSIAGLFVDSKVGVAGETNVTPDHSSRCYVLVETAPPAGYVLPDPARTALKVNAGATADNTVDVTIKNNKQTVPELPLTGASGQLLLMLGGGALITFATGYILITRTRKNQEN